MKPTKKTPTKKTSPAKQVTSGDRSAPPCSLPSHVYVVATGGFRIAIEADYPLPLEGIAARAIERFIAMGAPALGVIMEITECSDNADASDPHYIHTENQLRKVGRFREANETSPSAGATE